MEICFEKVVLDKLNKDFLCGNLSLGQTKLLEILQSYSEVLFYTNINYDYETFEEYKLENPLFLKIVEKSTIKYCESIADFIGKSEFKQSIVIDVIENHRHRDLAESKGGLYLTYENYSEKIEEITKHYSKRVDLSESVPDWNKVLNKSWLKLNELVINDNYLIDSLGNIESFIIPLIKAVKKQSAAKNIVFVTDYLNKKNYDKEGKENKLRELLNTSVKIYHNTFRNFSNHDRILYTNFLMIDCPIGFNMLKKKSNSIITIETIFDVFTYNRRRRHYREIEKILID